MTINSTDRESQATGQKMKDVYVGPVAKVLSRNMKALLTSVFFIEFNTAKQISLI